MAKGFSSGVEQIVGQKLSDHEKQQQLYTKTWRELRARLDSMLIGTNVLKGDVVRKQCQAIDSLDKDGRIQHITNIWGRLYADRAMPLILQLETVEKQIDSVNTK